jgi:hypothetical protein
MAMPAIESPDGSLTAIVDVEEGPPTFAIEREGRTVVEPSPLGVHHRRSHLTGSATLADVEQRTVEESFETASGKRREHEHRATEAELVFEDANHDEQCSLIVRAATDGVAYRYRLHTDSGSNMWESSAIRTPDDAVAWVHPYNEHHEATGVSFPVVELDDAYTAPLLYHTDEDWVLLAEAEADGRYAATRFTSDQGSQTVDFTKPPALTTWGEPPVTTPWRVAIVGDRSTVVESSLVPALVGETNSDGDRVDVSPEADWIEPGRVAWSWWSEGTSPEDPDVQREYVDYAADHGWEYVLIDAGWDAEWVTDVVEYAHDRDVGVMIWCQWSRLNGAERRRQHLSRWAGWGVDGLKIDFMNSDGQGRLQWYEDVAEDAAQHELLLNFHGSVVPSGLERRYPHVMTYEGINGAEKLRGRTMAPTHNTVVPFTRNVVGPMDYTPVTFSTDTRQTADGHELALSVVYESGLQHLADSVESYAARPNAEYVLDRVAAAWDETRFLGGWPGVEAAIARRSGEDWFVGAITSGNPRTIEVDPSFLDAPREGVLVRDGPGAAGQSEEDGLVREEITVDPEDSLAVDVAANGGFVIVLEG